VNTGMLWFDNSQSTLSVKITKAVEYYKKKYGRAPELCLVHPALFAPGSEASERIAGVTVRPHRVVLPGHLWIGVEDGPIEVVET